MGGGKCTRRGGVQNPFLGGGFSSPLFIPPPMASSDTKPRPCDMPHAKTEAALQLWESCVAEVSLQQLLFVQCGHLCQKLHCDKRKLCCNIEKAAAQESGAFLPLNFRLPCLGSRCPADHVLSSPHRGIALATMLAIRAQIAMKKMHASHRKGDAFLSLFFSLGKGKENHPPPQKKKN